MIFHILFGVRSYCQELGSVLSNWKEKEKKQSSEKTYPLYILFICVLVSTLRGAEGWTQSADIDITFLISFKSCISKTKGTTSLPI